MIYIFRVGGRYQTSSSGVFQATDESKPVSFACGSDFGNLPAIEKTIADESGHGSPSIISLAALSESKASTKVPIKDSVKDCTQLHSEHTNSYSVKDDSVTDGVSTRSSSRSCSGRLLVDNLMNDKGSDKVQKACSTNTLMEHAESSDSHISVEFAQYFNEGYCQVSELNDCRELTEAVTDADSNSSHCEREKSEEDGDNDDMVGGVFAFSEEGEPKNSRDLLFSTESKFSVAVRSMQRREEASSTRIDFPFILKPASITTIFWDTRPSPATNPPQNRKERGGFPPTSSLFTVPPLKCSRPSPRESRQPT
ncbi:hypothetical protein GW17_00054621 [Ensete ventricosum]|nr:hypothetical protein GW17_00054621 [Ensete ventricosum]